MSLTRGETSEEVRVDASQIVMTGHHEGGPLSSFCRRCGICWCHVSQDAPFSRGQRQLDALGTMALDSLDGSTAEGPVAGQGQVTVFVDARQVNPIETTAVIGYGPRVGPDALEEIMCSGSVQIVGLDTNAIPVVTTPATRTIPPAIRHTVAYRDAVCVIDGCASRYRLEPHHITRFKYCDALELCSNSQGTPEAFPTTTSLYTATATT